MSCFFGCFGTPNKGRRRKIANKSPSVGRVQIQLEQKYETETHQAIQPILVQKKLVHESIVSEGLPVQELRDKTEQPSFNKTKKKVKFDLNVTTYEEADVCKDTSISMDADQQEHEGKEEEKRLEVEESLASPRLGVFPVNHRYQNSIFSDDECIDEDIEDEFDDDLEDSDLDFEGNDVTINGGEEEEESFDSYFSLQIDKGWPEFEEVTNGKNGNAKSAETKPAVPASHGVHDRSSSIHSVLNPVENLSQWKVVKGKQAFIKKGTTTDCHLKEKPDVISAKLEVVDVNASLSNWLPPQEAVDVDTKLNL